MWSLFSVESSHGQPACLTKHLFSHTRPCMVVSWSFYFTLIMLYKYWRNNLCIIWYGRTCSLYKENFSIKYKWRVRAISLSRILYYQHKINIRVVRYIYIFLAPLCIHITWHILVDIQFQTLYDMECNYPLLTINKRKQYHRNNITISTFYHAYIL